MRSSELIGSLYMHLCSASMTCFFCSIPSSVHTGFLVVVKKYFPVCKFLQMLRCALRRGPSCSLANDCITAMAEGLSTPFYKHFLQHFWGNCETADLPKPNSGVDEWESFKSVILQRYRKSQSTSQPNSVLVSSSWEFLVNSEFHKNYCNHNFFPGISNEGLDDRLVDRFSSSMRGLQNPEGFSYSEFLIECLDSLHAIYENLKLSNLRKR